MTGHVPAELGRSVPVPALDGTSPGRQDGPQGGRASNRAPSLRLWVMSDLHVDARPLPFPESLPDFDAMVVAGNVSCDLDASLRWLAAVLAGRQGARPVVLVPGNGEFWNGLTKAETLRRGRALASELGIRLLSDEAMRIEDRHGRGTHLIGSTFWTDWALHGRDRATLARGYARHSHVDCRRIRLGQDARYLPHDAAGAHARSRAYIEDALVSLKVAAEGFGLSPVAVVSDVRPGDRAVVVTHHAPSRRSVPSRLGPDVCDEWISASCASDAEDLMSMWGAPALWIHGHILEAVDYRVGKTRVVSNPRGRRGQRSAFDPSLVVEV